MTGSPELTSVTAHCYRNREMNDQQKFIGKVIMVIALSTGGWFVTLSTWHSGLTPAALGGLLLILGSQLGGILGIIPPSVSRAVDIALLPGVHTQDEVKRIVKATDPGTVPSPETAAAILGKSVSIK